MEITEEEPVYQETVVAHEVFWEDEQLDHEENHPPVHQILHPTTSDENQDEEEILADGREETVENDQSEEKVEELPEENSEHMIIETDNGPEQFHIIYKGEQSSHDDHLAEFDEEVIDTGTNRVSRHPSRRKKVLTDDTMPKHLQRVPHCSKFKCLLCNKEIARSTMAYHIYCDPSIPKPFSCITCAKEFRTLQHYQYHLESHEDNYDFPCSSCDKSFRNKVTLRAHIRQVHSEIAPPLSCDDCGKEFFSAAKLRTHQTLHNSDMPFECPKCARRFRLKENMSKHIETTHSDNKPFACEVCQMRFKRSGALRLHCQRAHEGEKGRRGVAARQATKYSCSTCGKNFTHRTMLQRHEKEHVAVVEEYNCKLCTVSCTRKDNVMRHVKLIHFDGDAEKCGNPMEHVVIGERVKNGQQTGGRGEATTEEDVVVVEEVENDEEDGEEEEIPLERKSSVIIYAGTQKGNRSSAATKTNTTGTSSSATKKSLAKGRVSNVEEKSVVAKRETEGKRTKMEKQEEDDFAKMSSDKLELYRKILMPSPREGERKRGKRRNYFEL